MLNIVDFLAMNLKCFFLHITSIQMRQKSCFMIHQFPIDFITNLIIYTNLTWLQSIFMQGAPTIPSTAQIHIENPSSFITQPISDAIPQQQSYLIYIITALILLLAVIVIRRKNSKTSKKEIALIGERNSGKTQLFIGLSGGRSFETVPSISNNSCEIQFGKNKYKIWDFIGDNLSKEVIVHQIMRFHTIVHVIDGTDSKKLSDAALFIYKVIINKLFQKDPSNYIVFFNKNDEKEFHGQEKLIKRLEDEIETIKVTRRNQPEQNEGQEDFLRNERNRIDLRKQSIQIVVGSARQNRKSLTDKLQELCG